jgi:[ribosomal protein S18]-alanine N-acetyltransferase
MPSVRMPGAAIRDCSLADLEAVVEIEAASFDDPYPLELFEAFLQKFPEGFRVAELEKKVAGYCIIGPSQTRKHVIVLMSLAVHPAFKRRGIASDLLRDGISIARAISSNNKSRMVLQVAVENTSAQALYSKFGFVRKTTLKNYYGRGRDAIEMELGL